MNSLDQEWLDLRSKIEKTVQLSESSIQLGGRDFVWYRVANPDVLLEYAVSGDGEQLAEEIDPFWAATWRAAQGLDRFLGSLDIQGKRVLELGCGSGQAGTGAAARGAEVTLTDSVDLALDVAKLNSWPVADHVRLRKLIWGKERLDVEAFPIVIGSDLVYDPSLFPALEMCARTHLSVTGRIYLSEPHRHTGDLFSAWIREAGWKTVEHDIDLNDNRVPVRVFECALDT